MCFGKYNNYIENGIKELNKNFFFKQNEKKM